MAPERSDGRTGVSPRLVRWLWFLVGVAGAVVFVLGAYRPASRFLPAPIFHGVVWLPTVVAIAGGALFGLGISKWWDLRPGGAVQRMRPPPRRPDLEGVRAAPSFEVYDPRSKRKRPWWRR